MNDKEIMKEIQKSVSKTIDREIMKCLGAEYHKPKELNCNPFRRFKGYDCQNENGRHVQ